MKVAYFDCISGISGNMTLAAMLACGLDEGKLKAELARLPLPGWHLQRKKVDRNGIQAEHVEVEEHSFSHGHDHHDHEHHDHSHSHQHRGLQDIRQLIRQAEYDVPVEELAIAIFTRLAEAEAAIHGTTPEEVHFHEVGAVDAIIDIVGTAIGIHALGIEKVYASALPVGNGWVHCAHGEFPIPAPATARLLQGVPIAESNIEAELVTPTGAAIITTLCERFGAMPTMTISTVGYGAGTRELARPNVLRLYIGETLDSAMPPEEIVVLECNIDDMTGETLGYVMEQLLEIGALDVYYQPVYMKKNRPGIVINLLCEISDETDCLNTLFRETTTLGVRRNIVQRVCLPREIETISTRFGDVRVKVSEWDGHFRAEPEYEDCRRIAIELDIPLREVYLEVRSVAGIPYE